LRHHEAESAFGDLVRCIKETFPDVLRVTTEVKEDREAPGTFTIVCDAFLRTAQPMDSQLQAERRFTRRVCDVVPQRLSLLFVNHFHHAQE